MCQRTNKPLTGTIIRERGRDQKLMAGEKRRLAAAGPLPCCCSDPRRGEHSAAPAGKATLTAHASTRDCGVASARATQSCRLVNVTPHQPSPMANWGMKNTR